MAAVAPPRHAPLAMTTAAPSSYSTAPLPSLPNADAASQLPRPLIRTPQPQSDGPRHPIKRKWRSLVNFFALPIRAYYLEPPGEAYRAELRARRANMWDENGLQYNIWPCPAYTDQVGDDEMVLFKAQEEAEAIAAAHAQAMRRDQQAHAQEETDDSSEDDEDERAQEPVAVSSVWPQTPPEGGPMRALGMPFAEPSPRYERSDPLAVATPPSRRRVRTASNDALTAPDFANGITMSRHTSTPLSASSPAPGAAASFLSRRSRAQSSATRPSTSASGRTISEPLSWTLVRSQYSYPKRGLTAQQLSFLSSVESLGRFGVPLSAAPSAAPSPAYEHSPSATDYGFPTVNSRS